MFQGKKDFKVWFGLMSYVPLHYRTYLKEIDIIIMEVVDLDSLQVYADLQADRRQDLLVAYIK